MERNIQDSLITFLHYKVHSENKKRFSPLLINGEMNNELKEALDEIDLPLFCTSTSIFNDNEGFSLEDILKYLLEKANGDLDKAKKGIVVLKDFEKWSTNEDYNGVYRQMSLIPYLRGASIPIEYQGQEVLFDTSELTFILFGKYKEEDIQNDSLGYDSAFTESIISYLHPKTNLEEETLRSKKM